MAKVLITGANRGIGLELCRQLNARGDKVFAAVRKSSDALKALEGVHVIQNVDVTDQDSINNLAQQMKAHQLDMLINNAGILAPDSLDNLNIDGIRAQFEVNTLGPLRVTAALRPYLKKGAKVGIITSRMGSIADNSSGKNYGYRISKVAVNMVGASLAIDLGSDDIAVALLHPGFVRTEMTGGNGLIDADESAKGLIARLDALTLETSGGFWHTNGEELPW